MKSEVPKYKMITPSILADRLRVGASFVSLRHIIQNESNINIVAPVLC